MKLLASLLASQVAHGQAIEGGCTDGESAMTCVTECPYTAVGKKWNARHKLMFDGDDSVTVRLSPSPKTGMHKEENVDFRFTMRFDKQKCSKAILNAINDGTLSLEVADKNDVYDIESIYMDLETCPGWQQALYVQVKHSNPDKLNEWTYKPSANNHRDQFYLTMYGVRGIDAIGKARSDVKTCLEQVWVDRMDEIGEDDSDFTKCMMYDRCSKTPDWGTTTTTTTTTTSTTTTPGRPDGLPDYNDDDYTFTSDDQTCTLVMSDGQTFLGYVEDDLCNFAGIPYAEPPTGNLRWKSPRLMTSYEDVVDGTALKYGCATFTTGNDPTQGNASEDCLHVNVQVPITALENKEKLPMVAFIHGGAFNFGSNNASLRGLAKQGLVTVNIGYRLGPYGFMYLEEAEEGETYKGNWGLQDQLAGLKWISMYGGVFGGDKEQVTLDGCSAGSQAGWHHLTSEDSWPYFSRAVTNGVGLPAGIYYEASGKPTQITNYVLNHAGVSSIDELRQLSTGQLQKSLANANQVLGSGADSVKVAPLLDPFWGPVIDGVMLKDHLIHLVRDGHVRPNTPISINYSKDDPWSMLGEPWAYMRDTMFPDWSESIEADELSTGFFAPPDWQNRMFNAIYGTVYGPAINEVFGCKNNDADCKEEFARFITASTWVCNTRWALLGAYATNNADLGEIYPMQFSEPNCGGDENGGVNDKTCHCSESAYIHGDRALPPNASGLAIEMRDTFANFYKTGAFTDGKIKSWSEMNYEAFNFVKTDTWKQKAIKSWEECTTMDLIQDAGMNFYTWGYSKETPTGIGKPVVEPVGTLAPPETPPQTTAPPEPTTTALPDFPEEDPLPDFNSTPYTYSCDDDNICTLAMDNGWTFVGIKEGTIVNFRNIPFAEPPVGQLRWKSPRIITDYSTLSPVQATEFGPKCATFQAMDNNPTQNQSEDCLHLNIQVAEWVLKNGNVKQPIVAHIHGGSWNFGDNEDNLQSLVSQGMVAVNINYRLGPYAWLALPKREEGERYKANWGLLDQLAGLKWIQMMGGVFGGDINQVTLDGCSAGSASGWHHLTSEASWPYFHRAITNGISFPAGFYYEGTKTDQIRNHVLNHAGVSSVDELRNLSTGTLRLSWLDALSALSPAIKSSPTLDPMYAPVIEGDFIKDHTLYLVRNGHIRPNTPISMNLSKDDAWNFKSEAWEYLRDVPFAAISADITAAAESSGHEIPNPYPNIMFQMMYPSKADRMIAQFGCPNETDDCKEGFGRWVQATHWLCNARWALSGALKENPQNYGPIWPMHFEQPNCDAVAPLGNTKTCHCAETGWVRGGRAWNGNDLGVEMKSTWQKFYKTGAFDASSKMKSWEEMNFEMFNRVSSSNWAPGAINDWTECDLLDELQVEQAGYTWGYTKTNPNALPLPQTTALPPATTAPTVPPVITTTALPDFPEDDPLPDFNSTPYTYSCDDDNICTLAMDNGWTFVGIKEGTIVNFRNIPFAEPPVGQLRWKSPRIITDYSTLSPVQATEFGPNCATFQAQDNNPTQNQSEDCLHLNIQVAEWVLKNGNVKQPIVAHIHGGAWNFGTNTDDLQSLVSQGMVAVNINYRLGPYAWLALPEREEGERYKANWGLLDQLAGLKWIQMMGGVFGGDINQVTLDGCSAGSASGWHHLTSEASWPYFHRAVTNGISFPAGFYYEGTKTDQIRNHVLNHAGVSSVDELRSLSTGTLRLSWLDALSALSPAIKSSPTLDPMYAPVIENDFIKDHTLYLVRNGHIRPNTPISMNLSKDDAWNFKSEAWEYLRDVPFAAISADITAAAESSGHEIPNPYPNTMFQTMYPSKADRMIAQFGCPNETDDCKEGFGRWVQATHWLCNARWALSGALKENPENYGPIWPMHFEQPNCDAVAPLGNTKTCHCAETAWVRGGRAWNGNDLGLEMKTTWQKFYKTGAFDASSKMKSWEEMNFGMFNRVSSSNWAPGTINDWAECDLLDELQVEQAGYTWGYTKNNPNGLTQQGK